MQQFFMTLDAKKQLEERLKMLKVVGRPEMAEKIKVAREYGDISENAEYDIAKEEQAKMEGEIIEIENKLIHAVIIADKVKSDTVTVGSTVKVYDAAYNTDIEYKIVGSHESNPLKNLISNVSPIGSALIGHKEGDTVTVELKSNKIQLKIKKIS